MTSFILIPFEVIMTRVLYSCGKYARGRDKRTRGHHDQGWVGYFTAVVNTLEEERRRTRGHHDQGWVGYFTAVVNMLEEETKGPEVII
jgi:hypothetical protein